MKETTKAQVAIRTFIEKLKEWCDLYSASTLYASDLLEYAESLLNRDDLIPDKKGDFFDEEQDDKQNF